MTGYWNYRRGEECKHFAARKGMITITLEVNRGCNLRCSYCYITEKNDRQMTFETARNSIEFAINKIKNMNHKRRTINLDFLGGEPLLSFGFIKEIVEYCERRKIEENINFWYTITSNGTIFNEEIYAFLRDNNFSLKISLDGNEFVNDLNRKDRNGKGSYSLVKSNLEYFRKYEKDTSKLVQISNVLTKNNCEYYYESIKFFVENLGFRFIDTGYDCNVKWSTQDALRLRDIFDDIIKFYLVCAKTGKEFIWQIMEDTLNSIENVLKVYSCGAGIISFYVAYDGNYYACPSMMETQYCLGSMNNLKIQSEFMGHITERDQLSKVSMRKCQTCKLEPYCMKKGCLAVDEKSDDAMNSCCINHIFYELIRMNYYEILEVKNNSVYIWC